MNGDLRGLVVYKMTGSGNDFLFLDGRQDPGVSWTAETIRALCARRVGVGADGLVILAPGSAAGRIRFHFYNSDGARGAMCGNAALCATRLAAWLELAPAAGMVLETDAGDVRARCLPDGSDRAELSLPSVERVTQPAIPLVAGERALGQTVAGVDHLIVLVDDVNAVPMATRGPQLRAHPALGPAGANVNFVSQGAEGWAMRTWERGVEGETLACGTGAVASGAFLASRGDAVLPWTVRSRSRAELTVGGTPSSGGPAILADPTLAGEGRLVYRASLEQAIGSPDVATMG